MNVNGKEIEILAPAGNMENLSTAIKYGADSVYFGMGNFNARRNAKNFSSFEEVKEAVDFCHMYNKGAHLTLNTIVYDKEIKDLVKEIEIINKAKFDAIIVEDLGVVNLLKQMTNIPLHASTQLSVHNVSEAKKLKEMGFSRVVLAREMSLKEMKRILDSVDIEVEIFIHGALCMSVSGQCYFSSALGDRSGNRGLCAGVCRLPFYVEKEGSYDLSLKDVCYIDYIKEFADIGISSLKIEGRMKSKEYVKTVVGEIKEEVTKDSYDKNLLSSVFSRDGFTDGYITGKREDMFGVRSVNDKKKTACTLNTIKEYEEDKILLDIKYNIEEGKEGVVCFCDEENNVEISLGQIEKAKNKPVTKEKIEENLCKMGGTIFKVNNINGQLYGNVFIPVSKINEARREGIEKLSCLRLEKFKMGKFKPYTKIKEKNSNNSSKNIGVFKNIEMIDEEILNFFDIIFLPLFDFFSLDEDLINKYQDKIGVEIPRIYFDDEKKITTALNNIKKHKVNKVLAHTIGKLDIADKLGFNVYSGFGTNVANSYSVDLLENEIKNIKDITCSFENTLTNINNIKSNVNKSMIIYAHIPLMIVRNCPVKQEIGCKKCDKNKGLIDRKGEKFKVKCNGITSEIYNSKAVCLFEDLDKIDDNINKVFLFNYENKQEIKDIINKYKIGKNIDKNTKGCYFRKLI